jgi:hypothetical protein
MGRYSAVHRTNAGTNLTIISVESAAAARPKLQHIILGSEATPANLAGEFQVLPVTTAHGAGTALTPVKLDPTYPAVLCSATGGTMTEPGYAGGIFLRIALNQQATFQWWANPGFEPTVPVTTSNGIGTRTASHGGTPMMDRYTGPLAA